MDPTSGDYQYRALTEGNPIQRRWHGNKIALVVKLLEPKPSDIILDAGCGSGIVSSALARSGALVMATDLNKKAVYFVKSQSQYEREGAAVLRLDNLPFKDNSFHKACCLEVLEHMVWEEVQRAVAEIYRVLKPGGVLLITTPNYGSFWPVVEGVANCAKWLFGVAPDDHTNNMNAELLTSLVLKSDFSLERLGSFNHLSPFVGALSRRVANRILEWEFRRGGSWGNLLFCLCRKELKAGIT